MQIVTVDAIIWVVADYSICMIYHFSIMARPIINRLLREEYTMKMKKISAMLLAAIMAASMATPAFAAGEIPDKGWEVQFDPNFNSNDRSTFYKMDKDSGRLVPLDRHDVKEFAPGDKIYIPLVAEDGVKNKDIQGAHIYTNWTVGKSWVSGTEIVYKKADRRVVTPTNKQNGTYTKKYTFSGPVAVLNGEYVLDYAAGDDADDMRAALKAKLGTEENKNKVANKIFAEYDKVETTTYTYNGTAYPTKKDALDKAVEGGTLKLGAADSYSYKKAGADSYVEAADIEGKLTTDLGFTNPTATQYVKNADKTVVEALAVLTDAVDGLKFRDAHNDGSITGNKIYTLAADGQTTTGAYKTDDSDGQHTKELAIGGAAQVYIDGTKYVVAGHVSDYVTTNKASATGYRDANPAEDFLAPSGKTVMTKDEAVKHAKNGGILTSAVGKYVGVADSKVYGDATADFTGIITENTETKYQVGGKLVSEAEAQNAAKAEADKLIQAEVDKLTDLKHFGTFQADPLKARAGAGYTETGYSWFLEISTKSSNSVKDIDIVGDIGVGKSSTIAKNNTKTIGVTLTNSEDSNNPNEGEHDVTVEANDPAVYKFADDATEIVIEFGDDAYWEGNFADQKLNLAYDRKFDADFADRYDHANINFLNFKGEPVSNRTNTMYIYADEDTYLYEVTPKGAKKINGAEYDEDAGAWVFRTRKLTSYAISDKKLKTVDQMDSSSSDKPSDNTGKPSSQSSSSKPSGKPNPDTGR